MGTLETLARQVGRIGVFRPIVAGDGEHDAMLDLLTDRYQLRTEHAYGLNYAQAATYVDEDGDSRLIAHLVDAFIHLKEHYDFVLVIGSDFTGPSPSTELALNASARGQHGRPRTGGRQWS